MWLVGDATPWAMLGLGLTILIVLLLRLHLRYRRLLAAEQRKSGEGRQGSDFASTMPIAPSELTRWEVSMHETARELQAALDTKITVVQSLIAMARDEAERLEGMVDQARRLGLPLGEDMLSGIESLTEYGATSRHRQGDDSPAFQLPDRPETDTTYPVSETCRDRIYALADQGKTPEQICRDVEATIGEIEMVLRLR